MNRARSLGPLLLVDAFTHWPAGGLWYRRDHSLILRTGRSRALIVTWGKS